MTMYPKPCGPTPKWGSGKPTWDGESGAWVDDEGNRRPADQRAQDKRSRRKTEAEKERARETERARKRRLKEEETKEKERRMKQELETPAGGAEGQPLHGAPPGAGAPKKQKLERKNGYDTNNDLNQLLTQCLNCPVKKDRSRGAIFSAVITQITYVEDHCDMDNYGEAQVDGHSVVGALLLVRNELQGKNLEVRHDPPASTSPEPRVALLLRWCFPCDACAACCGRNRGLATHTTSRSSCMTCCSRHLAKILCVPW